VKKEKRTHHKGKGLSNRFKEEKVEKEKTSEEGLNRSEGETERQRNGSTEGPNWKGGKKRRGT